MKTLTMAGAALALSLLGGTAASAQPADPMVGLFAQGASLGNAFEIAQARIILEDSTNPQVRALATMMIEDHSKAQRALDAAGMRAGIETRFILDAGEQKMVDDLGLMDSPKLDETYLDDQLAAHARAAALLGDYATSGSDPALVAYARATLPTVLQHKAMLERMTGTPSYVF